MAKNINKTPITIKAILIRLVMVEVFELDALDTLLTVDDELDVKISLADEPVLLVVELVLDLVVLLSEVPLVEVVFCVLEFSVKFKSIA